MSEDDPRIGWGPGEWAAEVERLRNALEFIADHCADVDCDQRCVVRLMDAARDALDAAPAKIECPRERDGRSWQALEPAWIPGGRYLLERDEGKGA